MVKSVTIKAAYIPELIEVFGEAYQENIWDNNSEPQAMIPNPQTKAQFAAETFDAEVRQGVARKVQEYRSRKAFEDLTVDTTDITED